MNKYHLYFCVVFSIVASACVVSQGAEPGGPDDEEPVASAALGLTSSELSVLLTGQSLPITQGYSPNGVHAGVDFGNTGDGVTSVSAPVSGTIIANTSACGKVAIFDGSNTVILAHMKALTGLPVGSSVSVGTYLGKASKVVGGGCVATGPHIHIEIRTGYNSNMAAPAANNTATTRDPLSYTYGPFPAVPLVSPSAGGAVSGNPVSFLWSPIQGATSYRIQISQQNSFDSDNCLAGCLSLVTSTPQISVNLSPGTYYWRVRAGSSYSGGYFSAPRMLQKQ